jgi:hypothetical protein
MLRTLRGSLLPSIGAIGLAALVGSVPLIAVQATVTTTTMYVPVFPPPQVSVCNGDIITLTGDAIVVNHTTTKPDGDMLVTLEIWWSALTGIGTPSGTEYIGVGGVSSVFEFGPSDTTTLYATMRFIDPGGGGDHHAVARTHITSNANGDISVNITVVSFECRGS